MIRVVAILLAVLLAQSKLAQSTNWPTRPVRFIVPLAAGGTADGTARVLAERLGVLWGQQVLVENRAGGNTIIGTEALAKAAPDGYTIGMGIITSHAANPFMYAKLAYDVERDFTSLTLIATSPLFLIVHPSVPANTLQEFLAYARKNPGKIAYASTGYGSSFHLAMESFAQRAGLELVHVPYKGMGVAVQDLLAGTIQAAIDVSTMAQVRQGKLRTLGVVSRERFRGALEVPSFAEQGLADLEFTTWLTLHGPAGLPLGLATRISTDTTRVLREPEIVKRLLVMNYEAKGGSATELDSFLRAERAKIGAIIRRAGIKPE